MWTSVIFVNLLLLLISFFDGGEDGGEAGVPELNQWEDYFGRPPAWFPGGL